MEMGGGYCMKVLPTYGVILNFELMMTIPVSV
jgi:hypothetical protein